MEMNWQIICAFLGGALLAGTALLWLSITLYNNVTNERVRGWLYELLYSVDEWADDIEGKRAKREEVISGIQSLLGWRRIFLPRVVVGFAVDLATKLIRKLNCPDLHKEEVAQPITDRGDAG